MLFRALIVLHRWIGVACCVLFLLWFPSGIGMMYWGMPAVTERDRLARWPALDPAQVVLSPAEAAARNDIEPPALAQVRLNSFDGRPAYRFGDRVVFADTGDEQGTATARVRHRAAAAWTGMPASEASIINVTEVDQWMVGNRLRTLRPLWKYSWANGEDVYIGESGEVLLHTTPTTRFLAYISAVPHWLYFTPLRTNQPFWIRFATYSAMVGTVGAIVGVVLGFWLYSPRRKKYQFPRGTPAAVPYRGQKRWHTILGLIFGIATITWTFSGSLAFLPFPQPERPGQAAGRRFAGNGGLAAALRGRVQLADFEALHPRDLLRRFPDMQVKEIAFTSFDGEPFYQVNLADGTSKRISLDGYEVGEFDRARIVALVKQAASDAQKVETRVVEQYDRYYLDRTRQQPLPVILAQMNDEEHTRHYIDPKTATVVRTYSDRNFWRRWLYNGLHSFNFPWLYNYRPLWDIVVITFMLGGTVLCVTALVLAWRAVGKKLRVLARYAQPASVARPAAASGPR